jgi:glyoxylase-like metal-dependent hydrolase (beta-lactamase superfamily II)
VTKEAYIVDPVLDYDPFGPSINTLSASNIIKFIEQHELNVTRIIETHVHADHLSSASYLKQNLPTKV